RTGSGMNRPTLGIGVIGLGHWGPNHVRVFSQCPGARVVLATDPDEKRRRHVAMLYRDVELVDDPRQVLGCPDVDAVVIATPVRTHVDLARAAFLAGKHVLLEKPMCTSSADARELVALAATRRCVLVHGHVFLYNGGIQYVQRGAARGDFGAIQYVQA